VILKMPGSARSHQAFGSDTSGLQGGFERNTRPPLRIQNDGSFSVDNLLNGKIGERPAHHDSLKVLLFSNQTWGLSR
jgi:hypothetical protein